MNSIILIGPPGSGKSTVGELLAKELKRPFLDTDQLVEEKAGKKISSIFVDEGEAAFRSQESAAVTSALEEDGVVISLGGGAVMTEAVTSQLEQTSDFIVYLEVGIASAAPRIGFNRDRPLLLVNPRQQWLSLYEKRRPTYEKLADFRISTDDAEPSDIAQAIVQNWERRNDSD